MADVIKVEDQYYILATAARARGSSAVLKHADTFAVFDSLGDIVGAGLGEQGLYHQGTRFLSLLRLRLGHDRPLLLSSRTHTDNAVFGADLTNADVISGGAVKLPRDVVHIYRSRFLWNGVLYERLRLVNYAADTVRLTIVYEFAADYADIFEVRGTRRERRGAQLGTRRDDDWMETGYRGLDGVVRCTRIEWDQRPVDVRDEQASWDVSLAPHETLTLSMQVSCVVESSSAPSAPSLDDAYRMLCDRQREAAAAYARVDTSNRQFDAWIQRSFADVQMMATDTAYGPYPYAGVPWFNTAFGRDGIITALELLTVNPSLARGVLRYLAATQADAVVPDRDAEPGKILHETRGGEMAALGEVPFGLYYGSVDATPLFVVLAGAYYRRTADRALLEHLWPHVERALEWIDRYGDRDGDGFVEYERRTPTGLAHQGWKDSQDSVFHADGVLADAPIALCEVQSYVFGARKAAAMLARALGSSSRAEELEHAAEDLRGRFERDFWSEELGMYALALDGAKRKCVVRTSNAGQCLLTGIARRDRARRIAESMVSGDLFSGWGVRTVAATEARYNPMSYHNGSIWPHDNALVAAGFAQYGFSDLVQPILAALFDASLHVERHRLPELFCGFRRRSDEAPTLYPVACSPQAWSAGSVFLLLQASLGLTIDATQRRVAVAHAELPPFLERVTIRDLRIADASVDLLFERRARDVGVTVLERRGDVEVAITK
ncbi:MAG: amylo-alpha-1,6-glucosidase [Acidobacteria bacterium]|nr:MAG: amylo-alpha-1,6-glucosidase [Acidobacteriota bacterium]